MNCLVKRVTLDRLFAWTVACGLRGALAAFVYRRMPRRRRSRASRSADCKTAGRRASRSPAPICCLNRSCCSARRSRQQIVDGRSRPPSSSTCARSATVAGRLSLATATSEGVTAPELSRSMACRKQSAGGEHRCRHVASRPCTARLGRMRPCKNSTFRRATKAKRSRSTCWPAASARSFGRSFILYDCRESATRLVAAADVARRRCSIRRPCCRPTVTYTVAVHDLTYAAAAAPSYSPRDRHVRLCRPGFSAGRRRGAFDVA